MHHCEYNTSWSLFGGCNSLNPPKSDDLCRCSTLKGAIIINPHFKSHLTHLIGDLTLATIIVTIAHCLHFEKIGGAVFVDFTQQNLPIDSCWTVEGAIIINPHLKSHLIHLIGNLTLATIIVTITHSLHFARIGGAVFVIFTQQNLLVDSCIITGLSVIWLWCQKVL